MILKCLILALIQGLTEFLPISSSGHLVIFNKLLSAEEELFYFIILHVGTTLSILLFFLKDILYAVKEISIIKKILLTTLITGVIGLLGKDFFESLFSDYIFVICALFINGLILLLANKNINRSEDLIPSYKDSALLGFTQSVAIIPGISRSGITISTLLFRGIKKEAAFRFSFLAAIPIILASFVFELKDAHIDISSLFSLKYILGFIVSFITGYLSLVALKFLISKSRLDIFGYYCISISLVLFILSHI